MTRMRSSIFALALFVALLAVSVVRAQSADPTGHWKGSVSAPTGDVAVEVDLASAGGGLIGTLTQADQKIAGLPLAHVSLDGKTVTFEVRAGSGGGRFVGQLEGASMLGTFSTPEGSVPFTMTRTGAARIDPAPSSPPISKSLEGTWIGTLDVNGGMRVRMQLLNRADGTSTGRMVSVDEGELELPVLIAQNGASVTIDVKITGSRYTGTLNADGTGISGTYSNSRGFEMPLVFKKQ